MYEKISTYAKRHDVCVETVKNWAKDPAKNVKLKQIGNRWFVVTDPKEVVDSLFERQQALQNSFDTDTDDPKELRYRQAARYLSETVNCVDDFEARLRQVMQNGFPIDQTESAETRFFRELEVIAARRKLYNGEA